MSNQLSQEIDLWAEQKGFSQWGCASLFQPLSLEFYKSWIEKNYQGEMSYLKDHLPAKENPRLLHPQIQSALVFAHSYLPHPKPSPPSSLRTALYAQGEDYHFWLREKLSAIAERLRSRFPEEVFLCFSDSAPVLERDLAYRAGLGWVGKNSCLIHPKKGSLFLIGEILTTLKLAPSVAPLPDFCGTCTRCVDICPTQALESPRLLNAQKCISYLTIESREIPALELRKSMGDHFFGCDLCQTVCPWNQKVFAPQLEVRPQLSLRVDSRQALVHELRAILTLSGKKLQKIFHGTALLRAGPFGWRRNALVVAANHQLQELRPEIEGYLKDEKLGPLAAWALQEMV